MDLEYILGVISDGPAKSFAYRRIQYLESRWNLYCLLNEYQELAEMKVSCRFRVVRSAVVRIMTVLCFYTHRECLIGKLKPDTIHTAHISELTLPLELQ